MERRAIKPAEYNPRVIDSSSRRRLEKSIERDGLVETLVWNERTGNLVSGHQRLSILDEMEAERGLAYSLDVAVVNLDPVRERELNIRLNNVNAMGSYDFDLLGDLVRETAGINTDALGFGQADLRALFPEMDADKVFAESTVVQEEAGKLADVAAEEEARKEATRQLRKEARAERAGADRSAFVTFVFGDADELLRFLKAADLGDDQVQDGRDLARKMNIDMDKLP